MVYGSAETVLESGGSRMLLLMDGVRRGCEFGKGECSVRRIQRIGRYHLKLFRVSHSKRLVKESDYAPGSPEYAIRR
jgi:hypothetical protein